MFNLQFIYNGEEKRKVDRSNISECVPRIGEWVLLSGLDSYEVVEVLYEFPVITEHQIVLIKLK